MQLIIILIRTCINISSKYVRNDMVRVEWSLESEKPKPEIFSGCVI